MSVRRHAPRPLPQPGPRLRAVAPPDTVECAACRRRYAQERFERMLRVCAQCGHHGHIPAAVRAAQLADRGSLHIAELDAGERDPLHFDDGIPYQQRMREMRARTGLHEAMLIARATLADVPVVFACMDFAFFGGSLGSAAGSMFVQGCDIATTEQRALIAVCSSGGARMQEGLASLAQMARCSAGVSALSTFGLPYLTVLADPCFGGVTASFAAQGDVILAEPAARIGFAGGRVIEQASHDKLPQGFQTAEFLLSHGMVDAVVSRAELRPLLGRLLRAFTAARAGATP